MDEYNLLEYFISHWKFFGTIAALSLATYYTIRRMNESVRKLLEDNSKQWKIANETMSDIRSLKEHEIRQDNDIRIVDKKLDKEVDILHKEVDKIELKVEDNSKSISRIEGRLDNK